MAFTLRLPVVVNENVVRAAFEVAAKMGKPIQIETYFRLLNVPDGEIACDTVDELKIACGYEDPAQPKSEEYERGRKSGYTAGYQAGRRASDKSSASGVVVQEDAQSTSLDAAGSQPSEGVRDDPAR